MLLAKHGAVPLSPSTNCLYPVCRVPTSYDSDSGVLTIKHSPECDGVQYAYFAPYTYNKHRQLVARMQVKGWWCGCIRSCSGTPLVVQ